jgi:ABC-2 type transport system permease protein
MAFFIVFLLAGISFIGRGTVGTLERLLLTPVRRSSVALGYTFGFGLFATLQSIILIFFTEYVLGLEIAGSILLAVLIMILLAFSAIVTGMLVSIFANNEFQVVQFIPVVIIPQIFFSGMIPIDTLPYHLGLLSLRHAGLLRLHGAQAVIIQGPVWRRSGPELKILLAFIPAAFRPQPPFCPEKVPQTVMAHRKMEV